VVITQEPYLGRAFCSVSLTAERKVLNLMAGVQLPYGVREKLD
jgi:hypothetical protein